MGPSYQQLSASPTATPAEPADPEGERRPPPWWSSALFDVDESEMLNKRENVMNICMVSHARFCRTTPRPLLPCANARVRHPFFSPAGRSKYSSPLRS